MGLLAPAAAPAASLPMESFTKMMESPIWMALNFRGAKGFFVEIDGRGSILANKVWRKRTVSLGNGLYIRHCDPPKYFCGPDLLGNCSQKKAVGAVSNSDAPMSRQIP